MEGACANICNVQMQNINDKVIVFNIKCYLKKKAPDFNWSISEYGFKIYFP